MHVDSEVNPTMFREILVQPLELMFSFAISFPDELSTFDYSLHLFVGLKNKTMKIIFGFSSINTSSKLVVFPWHKKYYRLERHKKQVI